jgi:hypothetical protein
VFRMDSRSVAMPPFREDGAGTALRRYAVAILPREEALPAAGVITIPISLIMAAISVITMPIPLITIVRSG